MNRPLKILMLEDSAEDAEIIQHLLKKEMGEAEFLVVMGKEYFTEALDAYEPDLILSDNSLPGFSSAEALEVVNKRLRGIPFILVTGTVSEEYAVNIIKQGADDYILKDRLYRLPAAIDAAMKRRKADLEIRFNSILLNAVGQAVIATDMKGNVIYWNAAAEKIYGWSREEAMGNNILALTPSEQSLAEATEIMERLLRGETWSGEFRVKRKDGTSFWAFVADSPIYNESGVMNGVIGVSSDITEMKEAEQELQNIKLQVMDQRIQAQKNITRAVLNAQERERHRIGQELHDNVNQILAGTKMYLSVAGKRDEKLKDLIRYPMEMIDSTIQEIRMLSSRYVTPTKNVDLRELTGRLIENLFSRSEAKARFVYLAEQELTDDDLKINIYRIIQEQLNNILKHAEARNVYVSIETKSGELFVVIEDDGKGFDPGQKRKGIGISNMMNRIESFNGEISISAAPGKGSRIDIRIPY